MNGTPRTSSDSAVDRRTWWALVVLLTGMFMSLLDTTIVNVALQSVRTGLHAGESTLSWIVSGYALAFGIALIPAGRVGDHRGHKPVFIAGLALFTVSSLACGLAQNSTELVTARVLQGLGGGIFLPPVTALIQLSFPPRLLGKAFGLMGAVIGVSTALGPLVGGLLIQAFGPSGGWRSIFFVNLPIGALTLAAAAVLLPSGKNGRRHSSTDIAGLGLLSAGLVAVLVPLIEGQDQGWPTWTFVSLAGGAVLLVLFAFWERHAARGEREPIVPPHLFARSSFTGGVVLALVYFAAFTSIFFTLSLLWQAGLGRSALAAGLVALPFSLGSILGASQSDRIAARLGRTALAIGTGMLAAGLIAAWLIVRTTSGPALSGWELAGPLAVAGLGNGLFIAPNTRFIVATVAPADAGAASGVIATMQRVGSAIGIAVIGSVLFADLHSGFGPAAARALSVSVVLSIAAFLLVFTLPRRTTRRS